MAKKTEKLMKMADATVPAEAVTDPTKSVEVKDEVRTEAPDNPVLEVDITEAEKCKGKYVVLFRNKREDVAFIDDVIGNEFMLYTIMNGPDKGLKFKGRFFAKTIKVYNEDNVTLAYLR